MSVHYIKSLLPDWVTLVTESGGFELSSAFKFQLEWEQKLSEMWYSLTDEERELITPIGSPYTEEKVITFLDVLKHTKANRTLLTSFSNLLPDVTEEKVFPVSAIPKSKLLNPLNTGTHPVLFSLLKEIKANEWSQKTPVHIAHSVQSFAIGKYQVTQALWEHVMGNNPSYFKGNDRPVEQVSWFDCIQFCNQLSRLEGLEKAYSNQGPEITCDFEATGYRLPTEAEWEYAAKAGESYEYAGSNQAEDVAWTKENKTQVVGQKKPNGFGLHDMSGNVAEWCWDQCTEASVTPNRIYRGGGWMLTCEYSKISVRNYCKPSTKCYDQGLRICRTLSRC